MLKLLRGLMVMSVLTVASHVYGQGVNDQFPRLAQGIEAYFDGDEPDEESSTDILVAERVEGLLQHLLRNGFDVPQAADPQQPVPASVGDIVQAYRALVATLIAHKEWQMLAYVLAFGAGRQVYLDETQAAPVLRSLDAVPLGGLQFQVMQPLWPQAWRNARRLVLEERLEFLMDYPSEHTELARPHDQGVRAAFEDFIRAAYRMADGQPLQIRVEADRRRQQQRGWVLMHEFIRDNFEAPVPSNHTVEAVEVNPLGDIVAQFWGEAEHSLVESAEQ